MARFYRGFPPRRRRDQAVFLAPPASGGAAAGYGAAAGTAAGSKGGDGNAEGYAAGTGHAAGTKNASGSFRGYTAAAGKAAPPVVPQVVNQWSATFAQPAAFGPMPPVLQSTVIALDEASSVGGGTGTPSEGNWLFCITGWNQSYSPAPVTFGDGDDIGSWWRPMAPSDADGNTRVSVWYTPNLARQAGDVYCAPDGYVQGTACLVIEVQGLGPWDQAAAYVTGYAAASTALSLALPAQSVPVFAVAAFCGDLGSAGQSVTPPSGWAALATVSGSDGSDHAADTYLTSVYAATTTAAATAACTAASATDLSGVLIAVAVEGAAPAGLAANPAWPLMIWEAAFGAGFQTPPDQLGWTQLVNRVWSWDETTGIQYESAQLESAAVTMTCDNADAALSPSNPGSPYYSNALNASMSFCAVASQPWFTPVTYPGTAPWTPVNGAAVTQSGTYAYASAPNAAAPYSAQVTPDGIHASPGIASEHVTVTAGSTYSASAWLYCPAGWSTGGLITISWYGTAGTLISVTSPAAAAIPAAAWTQVADLDVTAPAGAVTAVITPQLAGIPAAAFYIAEAALAAGPVPVATGLVDAGTPVRMRAAIGTMGGTAVNRWYVWQRNAVSFPEQRTSRSWRGYVPMTASDIWSVTGRPCTTPYRAEVYADMPSGGWWWPCDDQPGAGGVQPVSLRNIAPAGTGTPLAITASPAGVYSTDAYDQQGLDQTYRIPASPQAPSVANYACAQLPGWMYGDPPSQQSAVSGGGPVTASPGSYAWQQTGLLGNTGANGWYLSANDTFPSLSDGCTVSAWFNALWWAGPKVVPGSAGYDALLQQPYAPITICALTTATRPVAVLQINMVSDLDTGDLVLITYNGSTATSHTIYSASDMRNTGWMHVVLVCESANSWTVYLNGGLTAVVSGTGAGMTPAWTWLTAAADFGAGSPALDPSGIVHGGNIAISHVEVYPRALPASRVLAHYYAAITGAGCLPAPSGLELKNVGGSTPSDNPVTWTPDGSWYYGQYGGGSPASEWCLSAVAVQEAGGYLSGPCLRAVTSGFTGDAASYYCVWAQWSGLAPATYLYTGAAAGFEEEAVAAMGCGVVFLSGYGGSSTAGGYAFIAPGTGASPPSGPSALGDGAGQRIERLLAAGQITYPGRNIDPAPALVQAALDTGGQGAGTGVSNIAGSDGGMLYVNNMGSVCYRQRPHLAADTIAWHAGPGSPGTFDADVIFGNDAVRAVTDPRITPYDPGGASLPVITPQDYGAAAAQQAQIGDRTSPLTSYLQSQALMQAQADWMLAQYGWIRRRAQQFRVDAASKPGAWAFVLGAGIGDIVSLTDVPVSGALPTTGLYRITRIRRTVSRGANGAPPSASATVTADPLPSYYWS